MSFRPIISQSSAVPTREGAGVHLHRAFGFGDPSEADPFLLFDDFFWLFLVFGFFYCFFLFSLIFAILFIY